VGTGQWLLIESGYSLNGSLVGHTGYGWPPSLGGSLCAIPVKNEGGAAEELRKREGSKLRQKECKRQYMPTLLGLRHTVSMVDIGLTD
jgi:hypothetical protein